MAKHRSFFQGTLLGVLFLAGHSLLALSPAELKDPAKTLMRSRTPLETAEAFLLIQDTGAVRSYRENLIARGKEAMAHRVRLLEELYAGNNAGALDALDLIKKKDAWGASREKYVMGLLEIQKSFSESKSDHFILRTLDSDNFLGRYGLPSLESAQGRVAEFFGSSPTLPSVIEIYPTLDDYAFAATISKEDIQKTGAVSSSRYGRVMILSPGATPFGYRWLDGMVHEYVHQQLARVSGGNCPVWLHEGASRYFEVAWRRPEGFVHSPSERALFHRAVLSETGSAAGLLPFDKIETDFLKEISPSQRALMLAETADAVDFIVQEFGVERLRDLLQGFRIYSRPDSFQKALGLSERDFEKSWRDSLADLTEVPTDLARGALDRTVWWGEGEEVQWGDDAVQDLIRQGDEWIQKGQITNAVLEYKKAVDLEPDNGIALTRLARVYLTTAKIPSAEELLKRATEKNPTYSTPFVLLGNIYFEDGRYEEAQQVLQQALEINPFQSKIHEILGLIAVDVGNFVLAKQSLELALRFDPTNGGIRQSLEHMPKPR